MTKIQSVMLAVVVASTMFTCAQAQAREAIDWRTCPEAPKDHPVRCATVRVPADWSTGRGQVTLRIARLSAADEAKRVGVLMFNPGGPGSGAVGYLTQPQYADQYIGKSLMERFDVVGIDPRGVAGSEPIQCSEPAHDPAVDRFPSDAEGVRDLMAANVAFAESCHGTSAEHLDTMSVAHDMDAVRSLLGEQQISFLGVSYGSMLGRAYAERFPDRLRALVLDGIVDRSLGADELAVDDAKAVQDSVNWFAEWCAGQDGCGVDVPDALRSIQDMADRGELKAGQANVTAREVQMGVNARLQSPGLYPDLAQALKAARQGDGTALDQSDSWGYGAYRSIICQDVDTRGIAARLPELGRTVREAAPALRGYSEFWDIMSGCVGWPIPARWQPHPWRPAAQLPPVLLVSGAHDVATPRPWAENTRRELPNSMLVRWDGDGHTAWPMHNECANARTVDYLITRTLPPPTTAC